MTIKVLLKGVYYSNWETRHGTGTGKPDMCRGLQQEIFKKF
jgi:hypothetical protein